jgi:hypothetical protein
MPRDVLITPATGLVEFKDDGGVVDAALQLDTSGNLNITHPGGDLNLGNVGANVYVGDGTTSVDIIFEQNGSIRALADKTLTLGAAGSSLVFAGTIGTITSALNINPGSAVTGINLNNNSLTNVNHITINDPGPNEGIQWLGGNGWQIYESPNDLTTNSGGNLQFVTGSTRRATFNTSGQLELPVATGTAPLVITSTTRVANLDAATAGAVINTVTGTGSVELVRGNMADNDQARILVGGTASNAGFLEIATADDGSEPIHVRQYSGVFSTLVRTATILDNSGNTSFPGVATASRLTSTVATGTAPLTVTSTTRVANLNVATAGEADTATTATNLSGGTVSATTGAFSGQLSVAQSTSLINNGISLNAAGNGFLRGTANDTASSTQANVQLMSWFGIGFSPTITGQTVPQGENAVWINTRTGTLDARGTVTAPTFSGALSGNASTATTLQTARTINGVSFNGSANITVTATATNALTIGTGLSGTSYNGSGAVTIAIDSTVATLTGTQTLTNKTISAASNTISGLTNSNLSGTAGISNANLANSSVTVGTTSISLGSSATTITGLSSVTSTSFVGALTGNASTATSAATLTTGRTISLTGDVTYTSGSFNGSDNVTGTATLANSGVTAASYTAASITVDAKGRVTAASSNTIPTVNDATLTLATSGNGISGSQTFTANQSSAATFTVTSNATNANTGSTIVFRDASGDFSANVVTVVELNSTSDRNLKQNIQTIKDPLNKVMSLRGVNFNWKFDDKLALGVIAQEVEQIVPEVVTITDGIKTVSYGNIVGLLIEAIKEQQSQIEELKTLLKK